MNNINDFVIEDGVLKDYKGKDKKVVIPDSVVALSPQMKLTAMARAFKEQLSDPNIANLSFEDRFGLLVDHEWTSRKNNHLKRLIKNARFAETGACVEDIEYHSDRNLDSAQIACLSTCDYISERHNIMLLGATGSGKTYIACALGMSAVRNFLTVRYVRLPELLAELAIARGNGTYRKVIVQYKKPTLLILDEWLLYPLKETEARDLLEIAEARHKKAFGSGYNRKCIDGKITSCSNCVGYCQYNKHPGFFNG